MGCDIHVYTEEKYKNQWINCDFWHVNKYYNPQEDDDYEPAVVCQHAYNGRDYGLFGILAGVRNYYDNQMIDNPRGIPKDAHKMTRLEYEKYGCDAHTPSWYTLGELMDWDKKHKQQKASGYISKEAAVLLDYEGVEPESWCQYTNIPDYVWREWITEESPLEYFLKSLKDHFAKIVFYDPSWMTEDQIEAKLQEMKDKLRVVFWFDN